MKEYEDCPCDKINCKYRKKWMIVSFEDKLDRLLLLPKIKKNKRDTTVEYVNILAWCVTCTYFKRFDNFRSE